MITREAYTLEFPAGHVMVQAPSCSPEVMLACSLVYSLAVSVSFARSALIAALIAPLVILIAHRQVIRSLLEINIINLVMLVTLAFTWPSVSGGLVTGGVITLRVNMIYVVLASMIFPMGYVKIYGALCSFGMPEKLRVLFLLTVRGIYILHESFSTAIISAKLRAPGLKGMMRLKVFACMAASALLRGAVRSEHMMKAIDCRGGVGGFTQSEKRGRLSVREVWVCVMTVIYSLVIVTLNYA